MNAVLFHRQKVLLNMVREAARPVNPLELMKWAFLLRKETPSAGGSGFYGFVPYRRGPFSFCLDRDVTKLGEMGFLTTDNEHLVAATGSSLPIADQQVRRDARAVVNRFGKAKCPDSVIDYVHRTYPAYTHRRKSGAPGAPIAVYTAGYEGLSVDDFLNLLVQSGIERLIDVRHNPVARRYGFHKSSLAGLCDKVDIDYVHIPELGIVSALRKGLETQADRARLFDLYEKTTLAKEQTAIKRVAELVESKPTVLVCMEAKHCECHRSRLAEAVAEKTGLDVVHLGGTNASWSDKDTRPSEF